jgi:hypothetical protein
MRMGSLYPDICPKSPTRYSGVTTAEEQACWCNISMRRWDMRITSCWRTTTRITVNGMPGVYQCRNARTVPCRVSADARGLGPVSIYQRLPIRQSMASNCASRKNLPDAALRSRTRKARFAIYANSVSMACTRRQTLFMLKGARQHSRGLPSCVATRMLSCRPICPINSFPCR